MPRLDRILFLPDLLHANSSTLRTFDLARALTARGIEVTTIASGGRLEEKFWQAGLPLRDYYRIHRATLPYVFNGKIISLARSIEPSVVHARCPRLSPLAARLARACRVNYVVTVNSIAESRYRIKRSRRCGGIIACSQYIREWLVNNVGIPKEVITVIPNGVEIDPFKRSTDVSGALPDGGAAEGASPSSFTAPVVGMIGRFASGEGHDCFLEAASQIAARVPIAQFVIAGAEADGLGKDRYVRDRLGKVGLLKQTTIIPAFLDFRHLLASIDVLLVPSSSEGRSRLILDAMASRRPVVAAGVGENYEIIRDGENGLLVQKNDAAALAAKTLEVLSNAALRRHILDSAFESVRNDFSLARMAKDVIAFYLRVTE